MAYPTKVFSADRNKNQDHPFYTLRVVLTGKVDNLMLNHNEPCGIIVFGANGSGKTTLGRELARVMRFKHMDIEDYHFADSEIPYTVERSREECLSLMLADIEKYRSFVISAVTGDFGDTITSFYKLAVCVEAPIELRMKRIKQRAYDLHGRRVLPGGDMYEQNMKFLDFAAARSLSGIEEWAKTLACPVIRVDGACAAQYAADIAERFYEITNHLLTAIYEK